MSALEEVGEENFRANVQICPHCLSLFDGSYEPEICAYDQTPLVDRIVRIDLGVPMVPLRLGDSSGK